MLVFGQDLTIPELILSVIAAVIMSTVLKMLDNLALYGGGRPVLMLLYLCVLTDAPTFRRLVDAHPNAIMGGQLDRLCMPRELNPHDSIGPAIGNSLDACAALATDNMRIRVYIDYILEKEV